MENFYAPFSRKNTNPSITTNGTTSSSSNISLAQQYMEYPQNVNLHADNNGEPGFHEDYSISYNQNPQFQQHVPPLPQVNPSPLYPFPMGQSSIAYGETNSEVQDLSQIGGEDRMNNIDPRMSKVAREKRRQVRQMKRSSTSLVPEGRTKEQSITSGGSNSKMTVKQELQSRNNEIFCTPDGKLLIYILKKDLQNSDVGVLGRIVLPKNEAEIRLPKLVNKEGIDVVLKDARSNELEWIMKYKYWINNKSRMYVLENTGDFVNHYGLQKGDSITLYEDEWGNLYVSITKEQTPKVSEALPNMEMQYEYNAHDYSHMHVPYMHRSEDEHQASLHFLNPRKEAIAVKKGGRNSSRGIKFKNIVQHQFPNNAMEETIQANEGATTSTPFHDQNMLRNGAQAQSNNREGNVYQSFYNVFKVGRKWF
ncbi:hypothetical protein VNO78_11806 [Psophocarpus tetragonolobus]|uniref:TF-B3 domain-containing protein n=1 Tax=Psophocarpus tetragonolobus TaxID=3891 RepID=A0AAN9SPY2_PSOTE